MSKKSAKKSKKAKKTSVKNRINSPNHSQTLTIPQAIQLAKQYYNSGEWQAAEAVFRQVLQVQPQNSDALNFYNHLGNVLREQGKLSEAVNCFQQVLSLNPNHFETYNDLGITLKEQGDLNKAIDCFQQSLALNPNYAIAHYNLGNTLQDLFKFDEAIDCYQRVLSLNPKFYLAYNNIGIIFKDWGMSQKAIAYYRKAMDTKPNYVQAHSNLLLTLNYSVHDEPTTIFAEHQHFEEQYAKPFVTLIKPHLNDRTPQRRLKIGYISADFRNHPVAHFIEPVLVHHNSQQFEIFCYYNHFQTDKVNQRLQQSAHHWINCFKLSDEELATKIRQDHIDILVDLTGHTGENRLLVFARKPAPVQVTYLGYPNTTGLNTIDYRITDNDRDPIGIAEQLSSETLVRIPNSYFCYRPFDETPPVNQLPALQQNYITFGSFNNYAKFNPKLLELWAQVLQAVSGSKFLIKTKILRDSANQEGLMEQFAHFGVAPERLILKSSTPTPTHLTSYHQVDIGLDTYPFNGGTTTCEALWMGVPVVTWVGERHASRMGLSILSTVGLTELIAYTPEQYVEICIKLANDIEYLQKLRSEMRDRVQASPLMDDVTFTRHLEAAYRMMWEKWCTT